MRPVQKHLNRALLISSALIVVGVAPARAAHAPTTTTTTTTTTHASTVPTTTRHASTVPTTSTAAKSPKKPKAKSKTPAATASNVGPACWKLLLNEWYGGAITTIYPLHCYREAIDHLPADIAVYSSAKDDIQAAELAATRGKKAPPEKTKLPSSVTTGLGPGTTDANPPKKKHGVAGLLADITPGDPQAFPLPLLILGALAILLVIAGGAGMVWQRTHPSDSDTV